MIIQVPASLHTAVTGVRRSSLDSGPLDPSDFREKRRKPIEFSTQWIYPSPEKKPTVREGHASPPEGERPSSSNRRSAHEGHSSHRLSAPLWFGKATLVASQSVPDASQTQLQTLKVRTVREGNASQNPDDLTMECQELALASTKLVLPSKYASRIDIMTTPEKEKMMDAHYHQLYAHKANEHCAAREEKLKDYCKNVDRSLRGEFQ